MGHARTETPRWIHGNYGRKTFSAKAIVNALGEKMWKTHGDIYKCAEIVKKKSLWQSQTRRRREISTTGRGFAAVMKSPKGAPFSTKGCYMKDEYRWQAWSVVMAGPEVGQGLRTVIRQVAVKRSKSRREGRVYTEIGHPILPYEWQTIGSMFTTQGGTRHHPRGRQAHRYPQKHRSPSAQDGRRLFWNTTVNSYTCAMIPISAWPSKTSTAGYITDDGITIGDMAQAVSDARLPRYSNQIRTVRGPVVFSYTFGVQAAEIRIEKKIPVKIFVDKFHLHLRRRSGHQSPNKSAGRVMGGVLMSIGRSASNEKSGTTTENGKITNPHFFKLPTCPLTKKLPEMDVEFVETRTRSGPFGAAGIGRNIRSSVQPPATSTPSLRCHAEWDFFESGHS